MLTIWPIDTPPSGAAAKDCDYLLDHYDLYGGLAAIRDARSQGQTLKGSGPFLIGWSPSNSRYVPNAVVLVIDMSGFDTQDNFDRAFLFWQQKIVQDPSLWRSGFARERGAAGDPPVCRPLRVGVFACFQDRQLNGEKERIFFF